MRDDLLHQRMESCCEDVARMPIAIGLFAIAVLVVLYRFNLWMWRKRYGNRDPYKSTGLGLPEEPPRIDNENINRKKG
jgi:hypothetical protein